MSFDIRDNLKRLPERPGVYLHKDAGGRILYVGKAINLKRRVSQYFRPPEQLDPKTRALVSHIAEFEYITTGSEMEALILENNLIKKHTPPYNIMLRDDKTYPYIKVTVRDSWPRLVKTRRVENDGARYFGPYTDVTSVNQILGYLNDAFALKRCNRTAWSEGFRPCLHYHLGQCAGMCIGKADPDRYRESVRQAISILEGKNRELLSELQGRMEQASDAMLFEEAALYRDRMTAVRSVAEKQRITLAGPAEMDLLLTAESETRAYGIVFFVRDGKLSGRESFPLPLHAVGDRAEVTAAFLKQYYGESTLIPKEILVGEFLPEQALLEEWLTQLRGSRVRITYPQRGEKKALLELGRRDVVQMLTYLDEKAANDEERSRGCNRLLRELVDGTADLTSPKPYIPEQQVRLEAYDISHLAGTDTVGGMVVFVDGKPAKKEYRKFRIKSETHGDDETALSEVLYRRMRRAVTGDPGFSDLPHLLLIDGGAGQVRAVEQVLLALDSALAKGAFPDTSVEPGTLSAIPVVGMVKDEHHRSKALLYQGTEHPLAAQPVLFSFIGALQEEVHRFSVEYQRGLRQKNLQKSLLDEIPTIGPTRRNNLLLAFGSVDAISKATGEELAAVPSMNEQAAAAVLRFFREKQ